VVKEDIELGNNEVTQQESTITSTKNIYQKARALRRKVEFFSKNFEVIEEKDLENLLNTDSDKINIVFRFLLKPTKFKVDPKTRMVSGITLQRQRLEG